MLHTHSLRAHIVALLLAATALVGVGTSSAFAAVANPECLACHNSGQYWTVAAVDRDEACQKCHTPGLLGSHPYHNPGSNCGAVCHPGWGGSMQYATPSWRGPQGSFASAGSVDVPASVLHVIHSTPKWVSTISTDKSNCGSCHATAACSACHEDSPSAGHAVHSSAGNADYTAREPWSGTVGSGITGEDQTVDSVQTHTNMCATSGCHSISGMQSRTAANREDHVAGVAKVGTWSVKYGSNYTGGRIAYTNRAGNEISFTFTGQQVEIISDKDPYRGNVEVWLDGVKVDTVDCYAAVSAYQQVVYRSPILSNGQHTLTVKVLGTKRAAARATYFFLDAFRFYSSMPESVAPKCASCHADRTDAHGAAHEASETAGTYAGYDCTDCHTTALITEHGRASSKTSSASDLCAECHPTYMPLSGGDYDYTCGSNLFGPGCHQASQAPHSFTENNHTVTADAQTADCIACHGDDLGVVHDDTNGSRLQHASLSGPGSNGLAYSTGCLTCHGADRFPSTKSCVSAACHAASGVVSMATHPAPDHDADPAPDEAARTGGHACSTCHSVNALTSKVEIVAEHGKSSSLNSSAQAIGCMDCHGAAYLPTDWLAENNTCVACHPASGDKAGAAHEALDYSAKHDFSAIGDNESSCGVGAGAFCHATDAVDLLHDASNPGTADCTSCHTPAVRQVGVPTIRACDACHSVAHDMSAHVTASSAECVDCHESADVTDVHAACTTCHANPSYPGLTTSVANAECTTCHRSGLVGSHDYTPKDPNHATGAEATHTASAEAASTYVTYSCTQCHSLTMKGAHTGPTAIEFPLDGYTDSCVKCHEVKVDEFGAGGWDSTCSACHTVYHGGTVQAHDASALTLAGSVPAATVGATCGGSGCHETTRVDLVHGAAPAFCATCHKNSLTQPVMNCGSAGCHSGMSAHSHELNAPASVHIPAAQTGCTDSGAGCHGSDAGQGYAVYHPDSGCTDGVCHVAANHSDPQFDDPNSCQNCHGGGAAVYDGAPDVVGLTDASPAGHYPVASHTATVGLGAVAAGGTASATCSACHDLSLKDAHSGAGFAADTAGSQVTCSGCHNYNAAVTAEVVTAKWSTGACADCHNAGDMGAGEAQHSSTAPVVNGTSTAGCGSSGIGCHTTFDLHALHKDASGGCTLSGCHDARDKDMTSAARTCGQATGCHDSGKYTSGLHNGTGGRADGVDAAHHTAGSVQANATYTYSSKTTACSACHSMVLGTEHGRSTSTLTGAGANACLKCHNDSATIASVITGDWSQKNTTGACSSCHQNTDGTSAATAHGAVGTAHTGTSVTGCTALGAGCHGTSATPDLTVVHASGCAQTRACHSTTVYNPGQKGCISSTCHPAADYNTTTYAHKTVDGTDTTHQVTSGMTTAVSSGGSASATCAGCHSVALKTAHNRSAGYATASLGWTNECRGCHNATTPIDVATLVASDTWSKSCTGNGCHNAVQSAHVTGGSAPAVTGVNSTTPACNSSGCHATLELHALHKDAAGGCSLSETNGACHSAGMIDRRPTQKTCGNTGGCHQGIQNQSHGVSNGGKPCNQCHTALNGMVNDTNMYHHVLDAADPFAAPGAGGAYPTSTTQMSCVSCHVDHSEYDPLPGGIGKGYSLRNSATVSNPTAANTDAGLCLSCHTTELPRNTTGQKANTIVSTNVWSLDAGWWAVSPHNYAAPGPFNDGSNFYANCSKCHGNLQGTLSSGKFSVHFSAEQRLLNALGDLAAASLAINEEQMCFRCHSKTTDNLGGTPKTNSYLDWYGTQPMSESNVVIYSQMNAGANTAGHKPHLYANKHLLSADDETQAYLSANKHVECADCHNHHVVGDARHEFGTTNTVSEAIRGVSGISFNSAAISTTNRPTDAQVNARLAPKVNADYEYEICLKCHSSANTNYNTTVWAGNKTSLSNVGNAKPYGWSTYTGPSTPVTVPRWTNLAADFSLGNQSRHPVIAPLPATDPGLSYPNLYGSSRVFLSQLSAGWKPGDTMYCSDCHGDPNAPSPWQLDVNGNVVLDGNGEPVINPAMANFAQGPHGSSVAFSLRGPRTDWPIASTGPGAGQLITMNMLNSGYDNLFCSNCHPGVRANKVHGGGGGRHAAAACVNCHILVPHGGGMSRLLGDGDSSMPARYAYNNDKRTSYISSFNKRTDPNTYVRADCTLTTTARGGTICGTQHAGGSSGTMENW